MRLNRFIADAGVLSRRAADLEISAGHILVNGQVAELGQQINPDCDQVQWHEQIIRPRQKRYIYLAFNKPVGLICTSDPRVRDNVVAYINYPERIYPIGRLDVASEGLLLLTDEGDIVNKILRAGNAHEKEYEVEVDRPISDQALAKMAAGVPILGTVTKPCQIQRLGPRRYRIILTQGLNRQIRRMAEAVGYQVRQLKRVRIMNIHLANLASGSWRELSSAELRELKKSLIDSRSESLIGTEALTPQTPKAKKFKKAAGRPKTKYLPNGRKESNRSKKSPNADS